MNTTIASMDGPRNIYWPPCLGEIPMITKSQKEKLTTLIYQNIFDENERELKLMELEDLTQADASYMLYQFETGKWD